jgi:hypothetical protein
MKSVASVKEREKTKSKVNKRFKYFILDPLSNGLFGFALFFSILLLTKSLAVLLNVQQTFNVDFDDVTLSLIGFFLLFTIRILENMGRMRD